MENLEKIQRLIAGLKLCVIEIGSLIVVAIIIYKMLMHDLS